jgi:DNA-binding transcriptional LysR family regulator
MWVAGCRKAWPGIGITLRDRSHECVLQSVRSGEVDFGIASNPAPCDDLYCEPLCVDPFQAVLPAGHPLAARESLGWGELGDASVLTLDQSSGPARGGARAGHLSRTTGLAAGAGPFAAIFGMVAMGLGIGVVPSRAQAAALRPRQCCPCVRR